MKEIAPVSGFSLSFVSSVTRLLYRNRNHKRERFGFYFGGYKDFLILLHLFTIIISIFYLKERNKIIFLRKIKVISIRKLLGI
jgi:hypothetical protein